jgi:CBS domain-containing protein
MTTRPPTSPSTTGPSATNATPPEVLDDDPPVTAVMTRRVVTIDAAARVPTALHLMTTTGVRHLPVLDRGRCVGMLVETDLIRCLTQPAGLLAVAITRTAAELRRPPVELPPTARASEAAQRMSSDTYDAVLVTDHGRVLGIVTATDLVRMLAHSVPQRLP